MDITVALVLLAGLINLVLLIWVVRLLSAQKKEPESTSVTQLADMLKSELVARQAESIMKLRDSIDNAHKTLNERLAEGTTALDRRMAVFGEIENRLGVLSKQAASIESVGKNIQSLSELLRPPSARGAVGELLLENLLGQILPRDMFTTQYRFKDGARVDAAVKLREKLIPVDAKFPLDVYERLSASPDDESLQKNFNRTLKKHTDDISNKYIRPNEQTTEYAVMYIPSEAVYYHLITGGNREAFNYALSKKVIPSSPGHFYAFLVSVAALASGMTMAQASLEKDSQWLVTGLGELVTAAGRLSHLQERMGGSMRALSASLERSRVELREIENKLAVLLEPTAAKPSGDDTSADSPNPGR